MGTEIVLVSRKVQTVTKTLMIVRLHFVLTKSTHALIKINHTMQLFKYAKFGRIL